jgi:hypothetical protein
MIHGKRPMTPITCRPRKSPGGQVRKGDTPTAAAFWGGLTDQNPEQYLEASIFDASKLFTVPSTEAVEVGVPPNCDLPGKPRDHLYMLIGPERAYTRPATSKTFFHLAVENIRTFANGWGCEIAIRTSQICVAEFTRRAGRPVGRMPAL